MDFPTVNADVLHPAANEKGLTIQGLTRIDGWIGKEEERRLLGLVDVGNWRNDLKRRVQHFGYLYDYRARSVSPSGRLGPLPEWLAVLAGRLFDQGIFSSEPDQVIINEYMPGQGISAHIDCVPCFGETIAILSLGGSVVMTFRRASNDAHLDMVLPAGSLLVLSGPARYGWLHAIPARKADIIAGVRTQRQRRVSLTFRSVVTSD